MRLKLVPNPLPGSNVFLKYNLPSLYRAALKFRLLNANSLVYYFGKNTPVPLFTSENLFVITPVPVCSLSHDELFCKT